MTNPQCNSWLTRHVVAAYLIAQLGPLVAVGVAWYGYQESRERDNQRDKVVAEALKVQTEETAKVLSEQSFDIDQKLCTDANDRVGVLRRILQNAQDSALRGATLRQGLSEEELQQLRDRTVAFYSEQIALLKFRDCATPGFPELNGS